MQSLASLTADEVNHATKRTLQALSPASLTFYEVSLFEDYSTEAKAAFLAGNYSAIPPRRAQLVISEPARRRVLVAIAPVAPSGDQRVQLREVHDVQPPLTSDEYTLCEKLIVEHPPFCDACLARGIHPSCVRVDTWCVGWFSEDDNPSRRLAEPILYVQRGDERFDTLYAQPLEGFTLRLDLWASPPRVVSFEVDASAPPPPLPTPSMRFPDARGEASRPPLAPLAVSQPAGAGFSLGADGVLQWQRWEGVLSFNAREGLVLSALRYAGRPVAWRLSFAEMGARAPRAFRIGRAVACAASSD